MKLVTEKEIGLQANMAIHNHKYVPACISTSISSAETTCK